MYSVQGHLLRADLIQCWKIFNGKSCLSPDDLFDSPPQNHTQGHCFKIFPMCLQIDRRKRSFLVCCIPVWNSLPASVVCAPDVSSFMCHSFMYRHSFSHVRNVYPGALCICLGTYIGNWYRRTLCSAWLGWIPIIKCLTMSLWPVSCDYEAGRCKITVYMPRLCYLGFLSLRLACLSIQGSWNSSHAIRMHYHFFRNRKKAFGRSLRIHIYFYAYDQQYMILCQHVCVMLKYMCESLKKNRWEYQVRMPFYSPTIEVSWSATVKQRLILTGGPPAKKNCGIRSPTSVEIAM